MGKFDFIEWDKRILEQKLRRHQMSQQEYHKYLKTLEDNKGEAEELPVFRETDRLQEKGDA